MTEQKGSPLFRNPTAQKAFEFIMRQIREDRVRLPFSKIEATRYIMNVIAQNMEDNAAIIKLMKEFGYKPKAVETPKKTDTSKKATKNQTDKPLGPGGN